MNNELLLLIKKHTDTLIEQTKTKPQETLEFRMSKQTQTFSFNPPINLVEEGKWLLGVTSFECTNSVFNITNENNSFSIIIPGHYQNKSDEKTINDLNKLLELKSNLFSQNLNNDTFVGYLLLVLNVLSERKNIPMLVSY